MGSSGLVLSSGFTCSDIYEAEAKEAMLSIAKKKIPRMMERITSVIRRHRLPSDTPPSASRRDI